MERVKNKIYIGLFIVFIFGFSLLNFITPSREISETENRPLQQFPKFSLERLVSGEFTSEFDTYMSDQFVLKDNWVGLKSDIERLLIKGKNNNVYFGKDGYLLEEFLTEGNYFDRNLEAINSFHEKMPNLLTTVMLIPTAVKIYEDKLPMFAPTYDQSLMLNEAEAELNVELIDAFSVLKAHRDEYIYYKTDHHWTTLGAFYVYQALMNTLGEQPYSLDSFAIETVSNQFYGTYYSKANNHHLSPDSIDIFHPTFSFEAEVSWDSGQKKLDGLYDDQYLDSKDKYSMFLGGNHPLTIIKSNVNNGKKIVVFKDSYAHSFAPFLALHYEEVHLIDLRYFNINPYDYIRDQEIEQALFLYNLSTFSTEPNIIKLKTFK